MRTKVTLACTECKQRNYDSMKNKKNDPDRLEMKKYCKDRKTVVFLPLVKTSQKFRDILNSNGFKAAEVNGDSKDRAEILKDFENDKYNVLCNSMLLTEGWDCPSVD